VRLRIEGHHLPGRSVGAYDDVHVALQVAGDPLDPVPGDASSGHWQTEVQVVEGPGGRDFRGPAVHGRRGERFVYLTWGTTTTGEFAMFRRAKLMLDGSPDAEDVTASVHLTDECGLPRCARLRPPAVEWHVSAGG
jgi:Family of unknown function (DUF5990)